MTAYFFTPQQQALLELFDKRVDNYQQQLLCCQQAFTEEAVHDLRVAIRRLLALLDALYAVEGGIPRRRQLRRQLKRQLRSLGALRDTQVMLLAVRSWPMTRAAQAFAHALQKQEAVLLAEVVLSLANCPLDGILSGLMKTRRQLLARLPGITLPQACLQVADKAFGKVLNRARKARRGHLADIHRVRIAFKHFRYSVEIAGQVGFAGDKPLFRALRQWQTLLGDIQDAAVLEAAIADFASKPCEFDLLPLRELASRRQLECLQRYAREVNSLPGLWFPAGRAGRV